MMQNYKDTLTTFWYVPIPSQWWVTNTIHSRQILNLYFDTSELDICKMTSMDIFLKTFYISKMLGIA